MQPANSRRTTRCSRPPPDAAEWKEAVDPDTKHMYYVNTMTGHTQWERPAAMGPAPHETGWFGRGAAGSTADGYEARNAKREKRELDYMTKQKTFIEEL